VQKKIEYIPKIKYFIKNKNFVFKSIKKKVHVPTASLSPPPPPSPSAWLPPIKKKCHSRLSYVKGATGLRPDGITGGRGAI
jgi:hypothetical protein